tara:strand:- start:210 stop:1475 length:1266 start_codon:yes stop_codon:yes gene_type:complete
LNGLIENNLCSSFNRKKGQKFSSNTSSVIILVLVLFIPAASFNFFYATIIPVTFFVAILRRRLVIDIGFPRALLLYFLFLLVFSLGKSLVFGNVYDLKELTKVLLFIMIFFTAGHIKLETFYKILLCYITIDLILSLAEFTHFYNGFTEFISRLYHASNHAAFAKTTSSVRASGLSPGPGQHGSFSLILFVFFFTGYFFNKKNMICLIGLLFSITCIFLSQSKTVILTFVLLLVIFTLIYALVSGFRGFVILLVACIFFVFVVAITQDWFLETFYEIERLRNSGLEVSSMAHRMSLWGQQVSIVLQSNIILLLFGAGRGYLSFTSTYNNSFDSDYIYVFVQFGIVGFMFSLTMLCWSISRGLFNFKRLSAVQMSILLAMIAGSIGGVSLDFISDIKIISIFAFFLAMSQHQKAVSQSLSLT